MNTNNYFSGKKVLITGITGFIGSALAPRLHALGADVYGISRNIKTKNIYNIDILDFKKLEEIVVKENISLCFHLAAESLVESGQEDPYHTLQVNVLGTLNMLELARKHKFDKVIISSTSHVYGDNKLPYQERYTPKPTRPYETSKTCTDIIAQSYADSFQLPVLIARFVNIYGPGDKNFNRLVPKTMRSIILDESPTMWGGRTIRDYLYIDDAVQAYISLAKHTLPEIKSNRIFNFGGGNKVSVEEVIRKIIYLSGKDIKITKIPSARSDEITKQYVSWTKAKKILGWKPKVEFNDGLKKTWVWYQDYFMKTTHISKGF